MQDLLESWLEPLSEAPFSTEVLNTFIKYKGVFATGFQGAHAGQGGKADSP